MNSRNPTLSSLVQRITPGKVENFNAKLACLEED